MDDESEALTADGFEDALIGFGTQHNTELAVYDFEKCVQVLIDRDGMSDEEAREFLEFNTCGAWVGKNTPVFVRSGPQ
jgi:hypothetical protein